MEELLKEAIKKFNEKAENDEKLKDQLKNMERKVLIELSDGPSYHFLLKDCCISGFDEGTVDAPDIRIMTDTNTMSGLFKKEIKPMKAYATGKLKVKASLTDLLTLKNFF